MTDNDDALRRLATEHWIVTEEPDDQDRCHWECSCGCSGSAPSHLVELASDKHIKYNHGEGRIDISRRQW